ncbi:hypothetical protein RRG08_006425, partial [Elysia crispata]
DWFKWKAVWPSTTRPYRGLPKLGDFASEMGVATRTVSEQLMSPSSNKGKERIETSRPTDYRARLTLLQESLDRKND